MQRIDENTYIDDTLVTCAEYQLFIDEMREQGKYFLPDHWTLYQFPKGKAREPILGVRHSDAVVFCEWLTKREAKDWIFRLPSQIETVNFQIDPKKFDQDQIGYWVKDGGDEPQFFWIRTSLANTQVLIDPLNIAFALDRAHDYSFNLPEIEGEILVALTRAYTLTNKLTITRGFTRVLPLAREVSEALDNVGILIRVYNRDYILNASLHHYLSVGIPTLQERIAGRSPAFEGIRLVKERIK